MSVPTPKNIPTIERAIIMRNPLIIPDTNCDRTILVNDIGKVKKSSIVFWNFNIKKEKDVAEKTDIIRFIPNTPGKTKLIYGTPCILVIFLPRIYPKINI